MGDGRQLRARDLQLVDPGKGYLQVVSGLLAFVFAAVTLVRFQGTQDRISLILGAGFLLSGAVLTAISVLFFQFLPDATLRLAWAPIAWWMPTLLIGSTVDRSSSPTWGRP